MLRATAAYTFSTSRLPKVFRTCQFLTLLTWKCASRHNSVQFFIPHLASWLRTRRFSEPTFRPFRAPASSFFALFSSLVWSSHFFSSPLWLFPPLLFHLSILSEVWLPNFLRWYLCIYNIHFLSNDSTDSRTWLSNFGCFALPQVSLSRFLEIWEYILIQWNFHVNTAVRFWLVVSTPLKNTSQLGWWFPVYGKITYVPNHQLAMDRIRSYCQDIWILSVTLHWSIPSVSAISRSQSEEGEFWPQIQTSPQCPHTIFGSTS